MPNNEEFLFNAEGIWRCGANLLVGRVRVLDYHMSHQMHHLLYSGAHAAQKQIPSDLGDDVNCEEAKTLKLRNSITSATATMEILCLYWASYNKYRY